MNKIRSTFTVSLMGVDGSGKTTISKKLKKKLKKSQYLHLKPYILFQDQRTTIKNPQDQIKSSSLMSLLRLLSWLVSYKIFFFTKKKNNFYIFDRYAHDILIDPLRYKHSLSTYLTKFILNFFPTPDLWIFLKPSFSTVKARKSELRDRELRRQIKEYSYFFKNKKNVLILNTNRRINVLITIIISQINFLIK